MKIFPITPIYKILNPFKNLGYKFFYPKKKKEDSEEFTELLKSKKKSSN